MIYTDDFIEKDGFFLRNLNINQNNVSLDMWSPESGAYGFYSIPYEYPLGVQRYYYLRFTYKFTTTNQSPTWCTGYIQGGSKGWAGTQISNPTAGVEYTISGVDMISSTQQWTLTSGTIYNGNSSQINGVKSQAKNVMVYDVTDLFIILRSLNLAKTTAELKAWCDDNLEYRPRYENYDIRDLLTTTSIDDKNIIYKGSFINGNLIEDEGMRGLILNNTLKQQDGYFDSGSPNIGTYNNKGNGTVVVSRVQEAVTQSSPFAADHPYVLKIVTNGEAAPGAGGFICSHTSAADKIYLEYFIAKVPVGYNVTAAYNSQGSGSQVSFVTPRAGTGDWEEYAILYKCGSSGSFSSGGHVYLTGSNNQSVTWYLSYCATFDITEHPNAIGFSLFNKKERLKKDTLVSKHIDECNLIPNGRGENLDMTLPTGWTYDTDDVAGDAVASIVQPVGAGSGSFGGKVKVVPGQKYKVSYWVKCKRDMSSFLTAIYPYVESTDIGVNHGSVVFITGTKTQLTQALNPGDMSMKVKNNVKWIDRSYSRVGFRSNTYKSYNDIGNFSNSSTGVISGITGTDTVNFKIAYNGAARAVNTYVVESFDGGNYPYPVDKNKLPTDNEWHYVEGYFGANSLWDGNGSGGWSNLPSDINHITLGLNMYNNNGTVPIKYADIKIEPVLAGAHQRYENKIQLIGGD